MGLFLLSLCLLILGYFTYGVLVEKVFVIKPEHKTPAITYADGVDYMPLSPVRVFLIQFLNIAGLGPVFGAILGALYGPVCLLWIVFGSIFAGGVHDYLSGMISMSYRGRTLSDFVEVFLGHKFCIAFLSLLVILLLIVGSIFAKTPAMMLSNLIGMDFMWWLLLIFGYYFLATILPIDKIVGHLYPFFAATLLIATVLLLGALFVGGYDFYPDLHTFNQNPNGKPIFPLMFITIACGALSGFHATQSPMMARCLTNEKYGRPIFYGAMILEGVVALIWATLSIAYFHGTTGLNEALGSTGNAGKVVSVISEGLLGSWGKILTVTAIVLLAITSGDTALRSARLSLADFFKIRQQKLSNRLILSVIIFASAMGLALIDLNKIWLYFGWTNQMLATIMLWIGALYLKHKHHFYQMAMVPAMFMTAVCGTYFGYSDLMLRQDLTTSVWIGLGITCVVTIIFFIYTSKYHHHS
ncbi:MAG: carbon starvation protein A [Alphaproteobacteria bacterium]|nr:carbon starvation protein A [Alphaproteobacteria bacterium]